MLAIYLIDLKEDVRYFLNNLLIKAIEVNNKGRKTTVMIEVIK